MTAATSGLASWRRRLVALFIDSLIIGVPTQLFATLLGAGFNTRGEILRACLGVFFALIFYLRWMTRFGDRNGTTPGKQLAGIRVVRDDGFPVDARTVLVRDVLGKTVLVQVTLGIFAVIDGLWPLGDRGNRAIHDFMGHTHVVVSRLQSPRERRRFRAFACLMVLILVAACATGAIVAAQRAKRAANELAVAQSISLPLTSTQPPAVGTWQAKGVTTATVGYDDAVGATYLRTWQISHICSSSCAYYLSRPFSDGATTTIITGRLVPSSTGWTVTWPAQRLPCGGTVAAPIYWEQQETWKIAFRGDEAIAEELSYSEAPGCGYGRASVTWEAQYSGNAPQSESASRLGTTPVSA